MIGDKIRQHRKRNNMSQEELAEKLNVSRQSISLWENNQTQPTIENIIVLSKLLGVSTDELLSMNNDNAQADCENNLTEQEVETSLIDADSLSIESDETVAANRPNKKIKKMILIGVPVLVVLAVIVLFVLNIFIQGNNVTLSAEKIYTKILPSVVEVYAESDIESSTGTGFFIDDKGTVVTNYHVIENCQSAKITLSDGTSYDVVCVVGYDANRDIAILSTSCKKSKPISIRDDTIKTGEKVYALGSSNGLTGSLSDGIISAVNRKVEGNTYIQTTAPVSHGNSGGPLVDSTGEVVGIVCASLTDGQNLNFAIPIAELNTISLDSKITLDVLFPEVQQEVEWLSNYDFSYYEENDSYILLFQLMNKNENLIPANGTVKIRIVNDDKVTVYNKTHNFSSENFEKWTSDDTNETYFTTIYIKSKDITSGSSEFGKLYFTVYGDNYDFEEYMIPTFGLPTKPNSNNNTNKDTTVNSDTSSQNSDPTVDDDTSTYISDIIIEDSSDYDIIIDDSSDYKYIIIEDSSDYSSTLIDGISDYYNNKYTCLNTGCDNEVAEFGVYCSEHKCAKEGCRFSKSAPSQYCSTHGCSEDGCDNVRAEYGRYCNEHTCNESNCIFKKENDSDYCSYHGCEATGCRNGKYKYNNYCNEHACKERYCMDQKDTDSDYCSRHRCKYPGCSDFKESYETYCDLHDDYP